jgi:hypothetical protein
MREDEKPHLTVEAIERTIADVENGKEMATTFLDQAVASFKETPVEGRQELLYAIDLYRDKASDLAYWRGRLVAEKETI